jgi:hypothetical protein
MKRICLVFISIILITSSSTATSIATEPELPQRDFFNMMEYTEILQGSADINRYKCKTYWDPSSRNTEIYTKCTKSNMEIYLHANAKALGVDRWEGGQLTYASFTAKKATAYPNLEFHATWCAGKAGGDSTEIFASSDWFKANYKQLTKGKKLSKVFAGLKITITGGTGATRTISCGVKPS